MAPAMVKALWLWLASFSAQRSQLAVFSQAVA